MTGQSDDEYIKDFDIEKEKVEEEKQIIAYKNAQLFAKIELPAIGSKPYVYRPMTTEKKAKMKAWGELLDSDRAEDILRESFEKEWTEKTEMNLNP